MAVLDFSRRSTTPELMDTEDCDFATFRGCLVDLARVNQLTLAYRPTLAFLNRIASDGRLPSGRPVRILDVASGHGDMLRRIARWGRKHGVPLQLTGLDLNPWAAAAAKEATQEDLRIEWRSGDVFAFEPDRPPDLVISSLFTHHLDDTSLVRFLRWMEEWAAIGWFVNDLHRHPLPHHVFGRVSRAMRLHRFVQHDGPISIARSFRLEDWRRYLAAVGLADEGVTVSWWMPFRLCVARVRPA